MSFSEWKEVKLGDIGEIIGGGTPSTKNKNYYGGNISWVTPKDLSNYTNKYIFSGDRMITPEGLKCSSARLIPKNTVLFSSRAPIGYIAIAGKELCTNQGFKSIVPYEHVSDSKFIYYMLKHRKADIEGIASGTTFLEVSGSALKGFKVMLPPLSEQKSIATTISCLDDKIELNNRINKTLEEMAQAIFKSCFVDFEPFQDGEFEDSELGRIPKGWKIGTVKDFAFEIKSGGTPSRKNEKYWETRDIAWLKTGEINNAPIIKVKEYISIEGLKNSSAKILPCNSIILAMYGATAGKVGLLRFETSTNQACCGMICNSINKSIFLYLFFLKNQQYIEGLAVGAAQQNLSKETISKLPLIIPLDEVIESVPLKELYDSIENLMLQNEELIQIRDSLLPKLMSGEIKVPLSS